MAEATTETNHTPHRLLIEAMLMMGAADGVVQQEEVARLARTVGEHELFADVEIETVADWIGQAAQRLADDGFEVRLTALAQGLDTYGLRLLSFAFAVAISFADGELATSELEMLKTFQVVLGLRENDVTEVVGAVQDPSADIDELIRTLWMQRVSERLSLEECYIECMLVMAAADGEVQREEATQLALTIANRSEFSQMSESAISGAVAGALDRIQAEGSAERLRAVADCLESHEERVKAMVFAYTILVADGVMDPGESRCLAEMQRAFQLDNDALRQVLTDRDS